MYPLAPVRRMSRLLEGEEDIWGALSDSSIVERRSLCASACWAASGK